MSWNAARCFAGSPFAEWRLFFRRTAFPREGEPISGAASLHSPNGVRRSRGESCLPCGDFPGEGAAPGPLFRVRNEASLYWIIVNIGNGLLEVALIPHKTVPILTVPWRMGTLPPFRSQMLVDTERGELFPCGDDFSDGPAVHRLDQRVNMIGHYDPCQKTVASRVEIQERGLDDCGRYRITESAASVSGIDPSFEAFAALSIALRIRKKDDFAMKPLDRLLRDAVGEVIGDVLQDAGRIKMRQVAAAVPPGIAIRLNGEVRRADQAIGAPGRSGSSGYGHPLNKKPRLKSRGALSYKVYPTTK